MSQEKIPALPNYPSPNNPVIFNPAICNGCNQCVEHCPIDVYIPNPDKGKPPIILHPEECWYCGSCVNDCRRPGAITFNWALEHKPYWKNKASGKTSQV
jgi:NAD-dependent dihydropyrimidine dehydrogenase PreA subunit